MQQFKAEWKGEDIFGEVSTKLNVLELFTQHNALCESLEERLGEKDPFKKFAEEQWGNKTKTITLPKPEWWNKRIIKHDGTQEFAYLEALSDASKALGIMFKLED